MSNSKNSKNSKNQLNSVLNWTVSHSIVLLINFIFIWYQNTLIWYSSCYDDAVKLATRQHQEWSWIELESLWPKRLHGDVLKRSRELHSKQQLIGQLNVALDWVITYNMAIQCIFWFALDLWFGSFYSVLIDFVCEFDSIFRCKMNWSDYPIDKVEF